MILHGPCNGPCYGPCGPCIIYNGLCNSLRRGPVTVPETVPEVPLFAPVPATVPDHARAKGTCSNQCAHQDDGVRAKCELQTLLETYVREQLKTYVRRTREQYPLLGWGHCGAHMSHARCVCVASCTVLFSVLAQLSLHSSHAMLERRQGKPPWERPFLTYWTGHAEKEKENDTMCNSYTEWRTYPLSELHCKESWVTSPEGCVLGVPEDMPLT